MQIFAIIDSVILNMATMNVSLPEQMKEWIERQVETGQYSNSSDYVRDLVRHDQADNNKRELLLKALLAGENSGIRTKDPEQI